MQGATAGLDDPVKTPETREKVHPGFRGIPRCTATLEPGRPPCRHTAGRDVSRGCGVRFEWLGRVMAKLYFHYSTMNAGKSTLLLQADYNYRERGMQTFLLTAALDHRTETGEIASRIGISSRARTFDRESDLYARIQARLADGPCACVFVDEAQFLSEAQVWHLARAVDDLGVPVMCYGLRVDFRGKLFPGSAALLALADEMREVRTICHCGRKATMVVRLDGSGQVLKGGDQIQVGGNETYVSLCRRHWRDAMNRD